MEINKITVYHKTLMKYCFAFLVVILFASCQSQQKNNVSQKKICLTQQDGDVFQKEIILDGLTLNAKLIRTFYYYEDRPVKYIRLLNTLRDKHFEVELTLKNNADTAISFWMMSCSWKDDLRFNDESFYVSYIGCDKNIPLMKTLNPNDSLVLNAVLVRNLPSDSLINDSLCTSRKKQKTRICFILFDSNNVGKSNRAVTFSEDDKIWSNELALGAEE